MIGHGVQRIRKTVLRLRAPDDVPRRQYEVFVIYVTFPIIHVVTWYKQEVNRVFEKEVNLVLVDVLPVSC